MNTFSDIKQLISTLNREQKLLSDMFKKRKTINFKYDDALLTVDDKAERIQCLLDYAVLRQNDNNLEIDNLFLQFFEQVLGANEEINNSYVNENLEKVKQSIAYYFNESHEQRKYDYLRIIKNTLRNIGNITLGNAVDLKRNINNTFKNEPNYKNKRAKLIYLDEKRKNIIKIIGQTEKLINEDEIIFFKTATDEELDRIIFHLKTQLAKCRHNLIEIERQIIDFLNQIQEQDNVIERLRKIKYLKDQITLETDTDIRAILANNNAVIFEPKPNYPLKLSLDHLQTNEDAFESIKKIAENQKSGVKLKQSIADKISSGYLETQIEEEAQINLEEIKNGFIASSYSLFDFVLNYSFKQEVSFAERITVYCQLVSQYENIFEITDEYAEKENVEFAVVYPK
jgi:hypothetical protein